MKNFPQLVVLCGGYGKRARQLDDKLPKVLFIINKKPFLYWILKNLEIKGIKKVVLCTGYKSNFIKKYIKKNKSNFKIKISISEENPKKLNGTGGAIKKIYNKLDPNFYVMYGDTFLKLRLQQLKENFLIKKKPILMTIIKNKSKYHKNNISIHKKNLIYDKFTTQKMDYLDYGIMVFNKKIFLNTPNTFDLAQILQLQSIRKNISYFIEKKSFFEIGDMRGFKDTLKNFKTIYNEIYK